MCIYDRGFARNVDSGSGLWPAGQLEPEASEGLSQHRGMEQQLILVDLWVTRRVLSLARLSLGFAILNDPAFEGGVSRFHCAVLVLEAQ